MRQDLQSGGWDGPGDAAGRKSGRLETATRCHHKALISASIPADEG